MAEPKKDAVLAAAEDLARQALAGIAEEGTVGGHLSFSMDAERLGTHYFSCTSPAYRGWRWAVTVARAPRLRTATVCETELVPGDDALLAPDWVPYQDRLKPGDIGPGDTTPYVEDDPNLEPGFEATGEEDVDQVGFFELGLGRRRVLSRAGREAAAQRWHSGEHGPTSQTARKATKQCLTCGYLLPMPGVLRGTFGVCTNEWSPADGTVVALEFGCGAHSEVTADEPEPIQVDPPVLDEYALEVHGTDAEPDQGGTDAEPDQGSRPEPTVAELPEPHEPSVDTSEATEEQAKG